MSKDNLKIWEEVRAVPKEAQKPIQGGRLKGMTDINPMWRIKTLTEQFGPVGKGWYSEIVIQWTEQGASGELMAFCTINLYVKYGDEWSKPIPGTGGSKLIADEKKGLYTNDEGYKMAYTDAISVACKSLGIGADIYWNGDRSKYDVGNNGNGNGKDDKDDKNGKDKNDKNDKNDKKLSEAQVKRMFAIAYSKGIESATVKKQVKDRFNKEIEDLTKAEYDKVCSGYEGLEDKK